MPVLSIATWWQLQETIQSRRAAKMCIRDRGLPALYYSGRENPPHPEIWINYFLKMMGLCSKKVYELSKASEKDELEGSLSYLNTKEKEFLVFLLKKRLYEFTPIEVSKMIVHTYILTPMKKMWKNRNKKKKGISLLFSMVDVYKRQ